MRTKRSFSAPGSSEAGVCIFKRTELYRKVLNQGCINDWRYVLFGCGRNHEGIKYSSQRGVTNGVKMVPTIIQTTLPRGVSRIDLDALTIVAWGRRRELDEEFRSPNGYIAIAWYKRQPDTEMRYTRNSDLEVETNNGPIVVSGKKIVPLGQTGKVAAMLRTQSVIPKQLLNIT